MGHPMDERAAAMDDFLFEGSRVWGGGSDMTDDDRRRKAWLLDRALDLVYDRVDGELLRKGAGDFYEENRDRMHVSLGEWLRNVGAEDGEDCTWSYGDVGLEHMAMDDPDAPEGMAEWYEDIF